MNFGPYDPVGDAEYQLDHLTMKDGQRITKYVVKFNQIMTQVWGYGEGTTSSVGLDTKIQMKKHLDY